MNRTASFFTALFVLVSALFAPITYILVTGDYAGAAWTYGAQEDSALVDLVFTVREFFTA